MEGTKSARAAVPHRHHTVEQLARSVAALGWGSVRKPRALYFHSRLRVCDTGPTLMSFFLWAVQIRPVESHCATNTEVGVAVSRTSCFCW